MERKGVELDNSKMVVYPLNSQEYGKTIAAVSVTVEKYQLMLKR